MPDPYRKVIWSTSYVCIRDVTTNLALTMKSLALRDVEIIFQVYFSNTFYNLVSWGLHNSHQHISSHRRHHHRVSYSTQGLVILKWISMPPGETHDSSYCLNGLPSTQPPLFLLNQIDLIIFSNHLLLHITWLCIFLSLFDVFLYHFECLI